MRIGILGAGPAGMLAALVARRHGAEVLWQGGGPGCPQEGHLHILKAGIDRVLTRFDADLGRRVAAAVDPAHDWRDASGPSRTLPSRPGPRLTRQALATALAETCAARGLAPRDAPQGLSAADLLIDATGGARALARRLEAAGRGALWLDDIGLPTPWRTEVWCTPVPGEAVTHIVPGQAYLQQGPDGSLRTGRGDAAAALPVPDGPPDRVLRMIAPPLRLARWRGKGTRLVLFGDARLQTPPEMGFGLMAAAEQAAILDQALAAGKDPEPALADWAESVWVNAGLQIAFAAIDAA